MVHKRECEIKGGQDFTQDLVAKAHMRDVSRWINAWYLAMVTCIPISMDLANREWGYHDTHVLTMKIEHTGLNGKDKDGQLFRVIEAKVKPCADVIRTFPALAEYLTTDSPGQWPRFRCVVSSHVKNYPTQGNFVRIFPWYSQRLREVYYGLDKRHSQVAAMLAIPFLLYYINTLKEPRLAEEEFRAMALDPATARILLEVVGNVTEESLQRFFKFEQSIDPVKNRTGPGVGAVGSPEVVDNRLSGKLLVKFWLGEFWLEKRVRKPQ